MIHRLSNQITKSPRRPAELERPLTPVIMRISKAHHALLHLLFMHRPEPPVQAQGYDEGRKEFEGQRAEMPGLTRVLVLVQVEGGFGDVQEWVVVCVRGITTEHYRVGSIEVLDVVDVFGNGVPVV